MERRRSSQPSGDPVRSIPEPEPARLPRYDSDGEDEREATELREVQNEGHRLSRIITQESVNRQLSHKIKRFWRHHVRISVPHIDCRDHLANERTFLAYLRTSVAFSMLSIVTAQLYRLQHSPQPSLILGYYLLSRPVSAIFQSMALLLALLGCIRFFRQQHAMAVGKVHAGGWEILTICLLSMLILLAMLVIHLAVIIFKEIPSTKNT